MARTELTLPKSVVRDAIKGTLEHVDLVIVRRGERVVVSVPIHTAGEFDRDGILEHVSTAIEVETEATSIPNFLALDLTGLVAGHSLYAKDVTLPAGMTLVSDPNSTVVHLSVRSSHDDVSAADAAVAAAASAASTAATEAAAAATDK
ncbi:MAG: 50S ribosomal protein L25 [Actinomycetota bacterium]